MYSGFSACKNELILANLADSELPQQMLLFPKNYRFKSFIDKPLNEEMT